MRGLVPLLLAVAACGGEAFTPTTDDVFGRWSLRDTGASRLYLNEPVTCEVSLAMEITSDTVPYFVHEDGPVSAYYASTGSDGILRCGAGGQTEEVPLLRNGILIVVIDDASIEIFHQNGHLMYAGDMTDRTRMGGVIPTGYWNRDGTWLALRH